MAATSSSTDRKSCSRKNKMKKLLAFVTLAATGCGSLMEMESAEAQAEKPLLKVAIMSDIQGHSYAEDAGMRNLERALDIFAVLKPHVVVNDGDINDTGRDSHAVAYYKKRCDERLGVLPHIACMGNHEIGFLPKELQEERSSKVCLKEFNSIFGFAADEQLVHRVIEGYDFIALSLMKVACYREHEVAMLEKALEKAVMRDSKKPIFVATHYHVKDTVGSSDNADQGGALLRRLFDKFPQVVSISGHTHNPLQDPRCIWQGNFTAVDSSTLCYGCVAMKPPAVNQISCLIPYGHESVGVMFLEVYVNRLVFRRFSVRDCREIESENPWVVPWPHNPQSAPYSFECRRTKEIAPKFAADPEPTLWYDFGYIYIMFNAALDKSAVFGYRIELADSDGNTKSYFQISDYYRILEHRQNRVVFKAPPGSLIPGKSYRCRIFPVGFFGAEGHPIVWRFDVHKNYRCRQDKLNCVQE